jgi:hypothetical protein
VSTSALNIREQLAGLSPAKRALIELKLLKKQAAAGEPKPLISKRPEGAPVPLSFYQQGLWVLSQLMPGTSLYHVPKAVRLAGKLDVAALKRTLDHLVERHESLRTSFATTDGVPLQVINKRLEVELPIVELSELTESERELETRRLLREEVRRPFDLAHGPLIRALLLRLGEQEHIFLMTMHHIITDGWSVGVMHREFMDLYEAFTSGQASPLLALKIQYPDYAVWQRQWFQGQVYE